MADRARRGRGRPILLGASRVASEPNRLGRWQQCVCARRRGHPQADTAGRGRPEELPARRSGQEPRPRGPRRPRERPRPRPRRDRLAHHAMAARSQRLESRGDHRRTARSRGPCLARRSTDPDGRAPPRTRDSPLGGPRRRRPAHSSCCGELRRSADERLGGDADLDQRGPVGSESVGDQQRARRGQPAGRAARTHADAAAAAARADPRREFRRSPAAAPHRADRRRLRGWRPTRRGARRPRHQRRRRPRHQSARLGRGPAGRVLARRRTIARRSAPLQPRVSRLRQGGRKSRRL